MNIKCLIISGGGPTGLLSYGAIKSTHKRNVWSLDGIESIYASSIGAFIACIITLGFDWDTIDSYLIERPWSDSFDIIQTDILEMIHNKGIDGENIFQLCIEPLLKAKDIPINITMSEFYNITCIELVFTVTELNCNRNMTFETISHHNYPNMTLIQAIASTTAYPMLFKPILYQDKCFIDGGLLHNLPINVCLEHSNFKMDEVLAFGIKQPTSMIHSIQSSSTFLEYIRMVMNKCHKTLDSSDKQTLIPFIVLSYADDILDITKWYEVLCNPQIRSELVKRGENDANDFMKLMIDLKTDLRC